MTHVVIYEKYFN